MNDHLKVSPRDIHCNESEYDCMNVGCAIRFGSVALNWSPFYLCAEYDV